MHLTPGRRAWLAGHRGLVGSAFPTRLATEPIGDVVTGASVVLEGRDQPATERYVVERRPEVVAAARSVASMAGSSTTLTAPEVPEAAP